MKKNEAVTITKVGNGFMVEQRQSHNSAVLYEEILVFNEIQATKTYDGTNLFEFLYQHFCVKD